MNTDNLFIYVTVLSSENDSTVCEIKLVFDKYFEERIVAILKGNKGNKVFLRFSFAEKSDLDYYTTLTIEKGTKKKIIDICENFNNYSTKSINILRKEKQLTQKKLIKALEKDGFNLTMYKFLLNYKEDILKEYDELIEDMKSKSFKEVLLNNDRIHFYTKLTDVIYECIDRLNASPVIAVAGITTFFGINIDFELLKKCYDDGQLSMNNLYAFYVDTKKDKNNEEASSLFCSYLKTMDMFYQSKS